MAQRTDVRAVRWGQRWLLGLLLLIPFQLTLAPRVGAAGALVRHADEISLIGLAALVAYLRWRGLGRRLAGERWLALALLLFTAVAGMSAVINQTGPLPFALGTFDYLKAIGYVWVGACLADERFGRRLVWLVTWIAVLAAMWTMAEMVSRSPIFGMEPRSTLVRHGIYRAEGPLGHSNLIGLYSLLALVLELTVGRRRQWVSMVLPLAALLSMSRIVHAAVVAIISPLARRRKWLAVPVVVALSLLLAASSSIRSELNLESAGAELLGQAPDAVDEPGSSYRAFTLKLSLKIWRDHPLLGVGAGRFGTGVSLALESPIYQTYPIPARHMELFGRIRSLDQFYPQLLAELGLLGAVAFGAIGVVLSVLLVRQRRRAISGVEREWALAGLLALVAIPIYCVGAGLNLAVYLVSAMTICGVALATPATPGDA